MAALHEAGENLVGCFGWPPGAEADGPRRTDDWNSFKMVVGVFRAGLGVLRDGLASVLRGVGFGRRVCGQLWSLGSCCVCICFGFVIVFVAVFF